MNEKADSGTWLFCSSWCGLDFSTFLSCGGSSLRLVSNLLLSLRPPFFGFFISASPFWSCLGGSWTSAFLFIWILRARFFSYSRESGYLAIFLSCLLDKATRHSRSSVASRVAPSDSSRPSSLDVASAAKAAENSATSAKSAMTFSFPSAPPF